MWARRVNVSHPADQSKDLNGEMMINRGKKSFSHPAEAPGEKFLRMTGWVPADLG